MIFAKIFALAAEEDRWVTIITNTGREFAGLAKRVSLNGQTLVLHDPDNTQDIAIELDWVAKLTVGAAKRSEDEWCPVCKSYHASGVGAQTAGVITKACRFVPTTSSAYWGTPLYTGKPR